MSTTQTVRATHYLVVTPGAYAASGGAEFDISIECPGIDVGHCEAWEECGDCAEAIKAIWAGQDDEAAEEAREAYMDELVHHGEEHKMLGDGELCLPAGVCFVQEGNSVEIPETAWKIAARCGVGRYPITWAGESYTSLSIRETTEA